MGISTLDNRDEFLIFLYFIIMIYSTDTGKLGLLGKLYMEREIRKIREGVRERVRRDREIEMERQE